MLGVRGGLGIVVLVAAGVAPFEGSFTAHMVQHVLIWVVAPGLVAWSRPWPRRWRPAAARLGHRFGPLIVAANAGMLWLWHWPVLYEAGWSSGGVHLLEHAGLFGTALAFWSHVVEERSPAVVVAVFVTAVQAGALSALLVFSGRPWYDVHTLADQQVGGGVMWVAGGALLVGAGVALFTRLLVREARHSPARARGLDRIPTR